MEKDLKDILLKDLCARLPYGVKISVLSWDEREMEYIDRVDVLYSVNGDEYIKSTNEDYDFSLEDIKPYLFPLSSMTEEQTEELIKLINTGQNDNNEFMRSLCRIDFYHKHHLDYRGLIEKSLALDATNLGIYE